jgi:hypothetical protein
MLDEPVKRRSAGSRFGDLGDRLARTFGSFDRTRQELPHWEPDSELEYPLPGDTVAWDPTAERYPIVRRGYECAAVDEHVAELEREIAELRERRTNASSVAAEIDRIGEQTAAILRVAHEQAQKITREAQAQADKCLSDAAANAVAITEDANVRLRQLDSEADSVWQERSRLIEDARSVATQLFSLAEDAAERFPPEPEKVDRVTPAAADPAPEDHDQPFAEPD